MKRIIVQPRFVDRIPKSLTEGTLYISEKYLTAAHNCCCGCGVKIVTPLKPGRWRLIKRNGLVSLRPSIGNWSAVCQSHYWISDNLVEWARSFTATEIAANRAHDKLVLKEARKRRHVHQGSFWRGLLEWIRSVFGIDDRS